MTRCTNPRFVWSGTTGFWSMCVNCFRAAWDHEQADPVADLRNWHRIQRERLHPADYPPVMHPLEDPDSDESEQ